MRPEKREVTFVLDGREVRAPEGEILVDAAKRGDIEIPVFCYEPKLGNPVGACRMCLVEIEGLPKLQAGCATPVRDGMVVYSRSPKAVEAQNATVEFLLANHPLDCPVCDKGGECPLQDISMGWGEGRSRFSEPKRHFQKPLPLSPLIALDRERCILCYRCVRFSQDVAEDEQLQLLGRGADTVVGTFDDRPYVAPFHGNIIELCPVGALTSRPYRFRARPWDIEEAGTVCTLCPSQCNVKLTVRDEQVLRVLARENRDVDGGWLCDKGRFGYQMIGSPDRITTPMIRQGGSLRDASWEEALGLVAQGLREAGERSAAVVGGQTSNEEGWLLQRIMRSTLGSPNVDSRAGGALERDLALALSQSELGARVSDLDHAGAILVVGCDPMHEAPVLDLRIRRAIRLNGTKLVVAAERPTSLDGGAAEVVRFAPGRAAEAMAGLIDGEAGAVLRDAADVVVVWGERLSHGDGEAARALLGLAESLGLAGQPEGGLLEIPEQANSRGLREVGCVPTCGPGLREAERGLAAAELPEAVADDRVTALVLANANPVREHPNGGAWEQALTHANFVVSIATFEDESTAHADVVLPAETHAEKDGTVTHFDGRLQRLRPGVPHPGQTRMGWQVLLELSALLGDELGLHTAAQVLGALTEEVPFYSGVTLDEIGGQGVRWQERGEAAQRLERVGSGDSPRRILSEAGQQDVGRAGLSTGGGSPEEGVADPAPRITLGTYRHIWADATTERNPALSFLSVEQTLELHPDDARRLGVGDGDLVTVGQNGTSLRAEVALRERMRPGAGFMVAGTAEQNANAFDGGGPVEVEVRKVEG